MYAQLWLMDISSQAPHLLDGGDVETEVTAYCYH
jgi:hypothetical protein